jgi:hypothetical protein
VIGLKHFFSHKEQKNKNQHKKQRLQIPLGFASALIVKAPQPKSNPKQALNQKHAIPRNPQVDDE